MKRILTVLCIAFIISGCSGRDNDTHPIQNRASTNIRNGKIKTYKRQGDFQQINELSAAKQTSIGNSNTTQRAKQLAYAVTELDEIKKASVVITGNIAIVGIEPKNILSDIELIKCKNIVEKKIKTADEGIDHVTVTAATELVKRVSNLADAEAVEDDSPD